MGATSREKVGAAALSGTADKAAIKIWTERTEYIMQSPHIYFTNSARFEDMPGMGRNRPPIDGKIDR
jgi:hypothetical protein